MMIPLASRYRGCLLGGAVGDALGAPVEFLSLRQIQSRFGPGGIRDYAPAFGLLGAITDDTQMTLFTAEGLLCGWVRFQKSGLGPTYESDAAMAYRRWLRTQKGEAGDGWLMSHLELHARRVPGNTCLSALEVMQAPGEPAVNDSKGCGGLMRIAPVALFLHATRREDEPTDLGHCFELGCALAGLTHGHPSGRLPAGVLSTVLLRLLQGANLASAIGESKALLRARPDFEETLNAVERAERLARRDMPVHRAIAELGEGWVAEEALAIALYCGLAARSFEEGVIAAVNHDGDSDSTGATAGNLLGLMWGEGAIPSRWLEALELRGVIGEVAEDLLACGGGDFRAERYSGG